MATFGDRVRVCPSPETDAAGIAGLEGDVYGFTKPSITGVSVIGGAPHDYALNVHFEQLDRDEWIRPDLVELLHHNSGLTLEVGRVQSVRQEDGTWHEEVSGGGLRSFFRRLFGRTEQSG